MRALLVGLLVILAASLASCGGGGGVGEAPTSPTMSVTDARVTEGQVSTTLLVFTATLSEAATEDVSAEYYTSDGTATEGIDYAATGGTLTIFAGNTSGTIPVRVNCDTVGEDDETLTVTLGNPSGATLSATVLTGTIENDDPPEVPTLNVADGGIKTLELWWARMPGASQYRVFEDPTGTAGFSQIGTDLPAGTLTFEHPVVVHRTDWVGARYRLEASNDFGSAFSAPIDATARMLDAIGYGKASNTGANDTFGRSVAMSADGSTLVVGAWLESSDATGIDGPDNDNAPGSGAAYVFVRTGATWIQQAYVKASNAGVSDEFGTSVALSADGNTLAVGAEGESSNATGIDGLDNDLAPYSGAAYVFVRTGTTWSQQTYVKASNTGDADYFGASVALSGDGSRLAVGAPKESSSATGVNGSGPETAFESGAAYVFARTGTTWAQTAYVKASNTGPGDWFGNAVALSGDGNTLVVGSPFESSDATGIDGVDNNDAAKSGAAYVFVHNGTIWAQEAYVKASNTGAGDWFGFSAALSGDGDRLAVGAPAESGDTTGINGDDNDDAVGSGAAYVFTRSGALWTQEAYVKASNTGAGDFFGHPVALSSDGSSLVVGAMSEDGDGAGKDGADNDNAADSGAAYVLAYAAGAWSQEAYLKASNTETEDRFGFAIAVSMTGDTVVVTAIEESGGATGIDGVQNEAAPNSGALYVY